MTITAAIDGAMGLLAPIGFVKWLLRTDPGEAGILTLFFFPVWRLLVVLGLLIGRKPGLRVTGGKRVAERGLDQIPSTQIATMVPSVARPLMVHPVAYGI
ncbi:hypothetical protein [Bradyrhizobium valentinum]|uniref:Uncharacterized protein n=1 Tax=Bradyrhizobium valentinum TaxID=1518501 RepID=A0A0R3KCB7_9BRAD|nr:hypothetical protein [Bradyrhizobium valentinum]KRQ91714.1 hypothetical protein CQ10_37125 [Bradyrhizobium valentinum]KRQ93160.1 hypothetical protein CP49_13520 [Bradyrhizobium valentinum]